MVSAGEDAGAFGFGSAGPGLLEVVDRRELVVVSAEEELGLGAVGEEAVSMASTGGVDRQAERDEAADARVSAAGVQAYVRAEGKAGE